MKDFDGNAPALADDRAAHDGVTKKLAGGRRMTRGRYVDTADRPAA